MKIGLCGTGSIGKRHIENLIDLDKDIEWVFLRENGERDDLSINLNAHIATDFDELVKDSIDAVIIANPSNLHAEYCVKCLNNDIPVYVGSQLHR